jgi:DNA-binding response OmpR family regulator
MILIIDKKRANAESLSEMFYFMGVVSLPTTPSEALNESFSDFRAVIMINPTEFYEIENFITKLRARQKTAPLFALTKNDSYDSSTSILFNEVFSQKCCCADIFRKILRYNESNSLPCPGIYKLSGINASVNEGRPTFISKPLPFTKTESMILRTLIRRYPTPTSSRDILRYAYKSSRLPDLASIRTHISIINKKFREENGKNLITLSIGEGYRLSLRD